jgi:5-hydroxyisourate hydrolase
MATLTTHVLNIATGTPAAGMRIELRSLIGGSAAPITAQTNADGRCAAPLLEGAAFRTGRYSLTFHVAAYFRSLGVALPEPPFLDEVVIAFGIADAGQSYHVPLLVSPWSYSTYRGS